MGILAFLLIFAGLFTIVCCLKGYRFFVEHRKVRFVVLMFGVTGMKIFYVTLGFGLIVAGLVFLIVGIPSGEGTP